MPLGKYVPQYHLFVVSCALQLAGISYTIDNEKQVLDDNYGGPALIMMKKGQEDKEKLFREVVAHAEIVENQAKIVERFRFVQELCELELVTFTDPNIRLEYDCAVYSIQDGEYRHENTGVVLLMGESYLETTMKNLSPAR